MEHGIDKIATNQPPAPKYLNGRDNFPIVPSDEQAHAYDGDNR